jgi:O-antigen/teichoic acid export membrane protein
LELAVLVLGDIDLSIFDSLLPLVIFAALIIVPEAMLRKQLHFGRVSIATISSEVTFMIVAIILAWQEFGVWSLVYGRLSSELLKVVLVWLFNPQWSWIKPKRWDWSLMKALFRYGLPTTGSGLVTYFHTHWDDWFVGRQFGTQALGYYSKAYDLSNKTLSSLSRTVINGVFFPSYSRIRDDLERTRRIFLKGTRVVFLMMVPVSLGLLVLAPLIVRVLLGEKWMPMVPTLQVYSFMVLFRPISTNTVPLFMGQGRPQYMLYAGLVLSVVMVPAVLLLSGFGIVGVALGVVISHIIGVIYNLYQVNRILPGTGIYSLRVSIPFLSAGFIMAAAVYFAEPVVMSWFTDSFAWLGLTILVAVGAIIYLGLVAILQKGFVIELIQLTIAALGLDGRFTLFSIGRQVD